MKSDLRSTRRQTLLGKLWGRRQARRSSHSLTRGLRRFECLEQRMMLHGGEDVGVNGPHDADPAYDPASFHIHANLSLYVNGERIAIPQWGGAAGGDSIHTHDATGTLHIHPTAPRTTFVMLDEVFEKWRTAPTNGNPNAVFNESNLLNNIEDGTHTVYMFVNGERTDAYENYQVHDGDEIVLAYSANPIVTVHTNLGDVPVELFADVTPITVNNFLNYVNDGDYVNSFFHRGVPNFVLQGGGFKTTSVSFADPSVANSFTAVSTDAQILNEFDNFAKVAGTGGTLTSGSAVINLGANADLSGVVVGDRLRLLGRTDGIGSTNGVGGTNMYNIVAVDDAANTVTVSTSSSTQTAPTGTTAGNLTWTVFPKVNVQGTLAMAKLGGNPNSATSQFFINLVNNDANLDLQNGGFTVFGQILDRSILTDIASLNNLSLFSASLTGSQEVPPVTTSALGSATLALNNNNDQFDLRLDVQGLSAGSITASHIHTGALNVEGPSVFDLGAGTQYTANGSQLRRTVDNGAFPVASLNSLFNSQTYLNVHTTANPDGEIRGQLTSLQGGLYSDLPTTTTDELVVIQSITGEGSVRGIVFGDADNDGVRDQNETGRQAFTVFADANNNGTLDASEERATTDASGAYVLRLAAGSYKIRLVPTNGFAQTLPASSYDVTVQIGRETAGRDFGVLQVPTLTGLDLLAATDSGPTNGGNTNSDNITNFNNSTPNRALQFSVSGVVDGAVVRILSDGIVIRQTTVPAGSNGNLTVTTDGSTTLADGTRTIIATQELRGVQSTPTSGLQITIDTSVPAFTSTPPTTANVGTALNYNVENPEEGQSQFVYSLVNAPSGAVINATTGTLAWTPTAAQVGSHSFQVVATDVAGNTNSQPLTISVSKTAQVEFNLRLTDLQGNPITSVNIGQSFQLRASVLDVRTDGTRRGVFSAYQDVEWDGNLATATTIVHAPNYGQGPAGTISSGLLDEIGSFASSVTPLGPDERLLYTVTFTADRSGTVTFTGNQPDIRPQHDIGIYDRDPPVPPDEVNYGAVSLTIINPDFEANDDVFNFDEDTSNNPLNVLGNDQGRPGTTLTILSKSATSKGGVVTIAADNKSLVYTPPANFFGEDKFTYVVSDGSDQAVASVTVQVVDVNDPPPAIGELLSGTDAVLEDSTGNTLDLLKNERAATNVDQGAPNEVLRILSVGPTSNGGTVVVGAQGAFVTYTPASNFSGTETFTYTVTDRSGSNGLTAVATATVTVTPQNDSPIAVADRFTVNEDSQSNDFDLLINDINPEAGETLTISSVGAGSRGGQITIIENSTKVRYVPAANVFGEEQFTYTISDGNGGSSSSSVTVTINPANDSPDARDDAFNVARNSTNNSLDVLANDVSTPDGPETFTITDVTQGNQGGVVEIIDSGARIRYRPAAGYLGPETFSYTMRDPGGLTDSATVTVTVRDFVPSILSGFVYIDADNDGVKDDGEEPLPNVKVTLTGTDNFGAAVSIERLTDSTGAYSFNNLAPGNYVITETQPTGQIGNLPIIDGKDTIGSQGGTVSANDTFTISLAENTNGTGNNFAEVTGFRVGGTVAAAGSTNGNGTGAQSLSFSNFDVQLLGINADDSIGPPVSNATVHADGSFMFEGVPQGRYALRLESLKFLTPASADRIVNIADGDSLNNVVAQGSRMPQYISYRDFLNSTPRTGIFAAVVPGDNGNLWSAVDGSWTGFTDIQVKLNSDGATIRIDATRTDGQQLFDEIPANDPRIVRIAQDGSALLLRLTGGSSNYNLRPVTTTSSSAGGEGESAPPIATSQPMLVASSTTPSSSTPLIVTSTVVQPGTIPLASGNQLAQPLTTTMAAEGESATSPWLVSVIDTASDRLASTETEDESAHDQARLTGAIDAVMAQIETADSSLHSTADWEDLADHQHHDDLTLLDAISAALQDDLLLASY